MREKRTRNEGSTAKEKCYARGVCRARGVAAPSNKRSLVQLRIVGRIDTPGIQAEDSTLSPAASGSSSRMYGLGIVAESKPWRAANATASSRE